MAMAKAKTKALPAARNQKFREAVQALVDEEFGPRGQKQAAKALGISAPYLHDFLNEKRGAGPKGAGPEILRGMAKFRPLDVLLALEMDPAVVAGVWREGAGRTEVLGDLPEALRRAARAAIELTYCTAEDAILAARTALVEAGDVEGADPDWWLIKVRRHLPERVASSVRRRG